MRIFTGIACVALALLLGAGMVTAAPPAVKMEVDAGFDGYYKVGEWIPFAVTLSNEGADLEGKVWIEVRDEAGTTTVYARPVTLPSRSRKRVYVYAFSTGFMRQAEVNFQAGDEILTSAKVTLRPLQSYDKLVGVVSSDPAAGGFLSNAKLPSLEAQGSGRAMVARFQVAQIPPRAQALKSLDAIIFSDVSTAELEVEQRQAIEGWIASGGVLLVGGGANGQKTVAGLRDFLPFGISGTRSLDSLSGLEELAGGPIRPSGPVLVSTASDLADVSVLARQGDVPLVLRRKLGQGAVVFLASDISVPPFNAWSYDGLLWRRILTGEILTVSQPGLNRHTGTASSMQGALSNVPSMDLPSVASLAVFLLVYILAIGPANYLVLRRIDKRELAWITIPLLTLAFTGSAYAVGFGVKGGDIVVHEITVLRSSYNSPVAELEAYIGIFSPARRTYQLEAKGDLLLSKPQFFGPSNLGSTVEVFQGEPAQIKDVNVNAWAMQPLMAEGFVDLRGRGIQSDLQFEGQRIKGRITNKTDSSIEDAVLLSAGKVARIGTLHANETKEVDAAFEARDQAWRTSIGGLIVGEPQGPMVNSNDRDKMRKRMIVDSAFGSYGRQMGVWWSGELMLLGWQKNSPLDLNLKGQRIVRQSTVLFVTSLPVSFGRGSISVPPGFTTKSFVDMTSAKGGASPFGFTFSGGSITLRHQLPPQAAGLSVKELSVHFDQSGSGPIPPGVMGGGGPSLQLLDWKQGKWIDQGKLAGGVTPVSAPASFVSASGAIEARLEAPAGSYIEMGLFDFSVKGEKWQ